MRKMTQQEIEAVLTREYPRILNDIVAITQNPVRLFWDPTMETAATDCVAVVRMAPWFYLEGLAHIGDGTAYHESGHIAFSRHMHNLMQRAHDAGGEVLGHITNVILDRKDDILNAAANPGFAQTLRNRLAHICTMAQREQWKNRLPPGISEEETTRLMKNAKPRNVYEDFFFAAKWHKRPRFRQTHKAMKLLKRSRLLTASEDELLWIAKRVREILGEPLSTAQKQSAEKQFLVLILIVNTIEGEGRKLPPEIDQLLQKISGQYTLKIRMSAMRGLEQKLKNTTFSGGMMSVGVHKTVPIQTVAQSSEYVAANRDLLAGLDHLVAPLIRDLRLLDSPSEYTLYEQEEGDEIDMDALSNIIFRLGGFWEETIFERDTHLELWLAIDTSGSMSGEKLAKAKKIVAVFGRATTVLNPAMVGRVWTYDSTRIVDYGEPGDRCGFVNAECHGGNSDTHMLRIAMERLSRSQKRQKVLIMLCDNGPDSIEKARQLSYQLLARGIIVIHLMVEVHATPDIYPFELLYSSWNELLQEFGELLKLIIKNVK